jgi:hypothetical protein
LPFTLIEGSVTWQWWFIGLLGANANIVHQWAHKFPDEKPRLIHRLQQIKVLQRPQDHAKHHTKPETRSYCTYTPWLNPILDRYEVLVRSGAGCFQGLKFTRRIVLIN